MSTPQADGRSTRRARIVATLIALVWATIATSIAVPGVRALRSPVFQGTPAGHDLVAGATTGDGHLVCRAFGKADDATCVANYTNTGAKHVAYQRRRLGRAAGRRLDALARLHRRRRRGGGRAVGDGREGGTRMRKFGVIPITKHHRGLLKGLGHVARHAHTIRLSLAPEGLNRADRRSLFRTWRRNIRGLPAVA